MKVLDAVESFYVDKGHSCASDDDLITKIVTQSHPSFHILKADGVICEELDGLLDMNAVEIVLASSVPKHAKVVGTRSFIAIRDFETEEERWKSRFVVQGCMGLYSKTIVSDAGCVTSMLVKILLILGFSLGYRIWTRDVKQVFLQGGKLTRKTYALPPREMKERLRGYLLWI